jgi:hypothetical protein
MYFTVLNTNKLKARCTHMGFHKHILILTLSKHTLFIPRNKNQNTSPDHSTVKPV